MAVVFCGKSALWLWRSGVRLSGPIESDAAEGILEHVDFDHEVVRAAVWRVNYEMGRRWHGGGRPEVLALRTTRRGRATSRVRTVAEAPELWRVGKTDAYVTGLATTLAQCSEELDLDALVLLGNELCGTYGTSVDLGARAFCRNEPRTCARDLRESLGRSGNGARLCIDALKYVVDGCASPMEGKIALLFALPVRRGGCGLPLPVVNREIAMTTEARSLCGSERLVPDFCWPEAKLIVEYDSDAHHFAGAGDRQTKEERDRKRLNAFHAMGYTTMSMTRSTLRDWTSYFAFICEIRKALGIRWSDPSEFTRMLMMDEHAKTVNLVDPLAGVFWYGRGPGAGVSTNSWVGDALI